MQIYRRPDPPKRIPEAVGLHAVVGICPGSCVYILCHLEKSLYNTTRNADFHGTSFVMQLIPRLSLAYESVEAENVFLDNLYAAVFYRFQKCGAGPDTKCG